MLNLGIKLGADIMDVGVLGQEVTESNVVGMRKMTRSKKAKLGNLLRYNTWLTRWSLV